MSFDQISEDRIYQDDRLRMIKEHNIFLLKALASVRHQKHKIAQDWLDDAFYCGLEAVKDNNQFYTKEIYNTYHKYYAEFKKIKYFEGAKWCLLQVTVYLKNLKLPKEQKTKILAGILKKYKNSNGDTGEVKARWQNPSYR